MGISSANQKKSAYEPIQSLSNLGAKSSFGEPKAGG
jgi:hypothetical protein